MVPLWVMICVKSGRKDLGKWKPEWDARAAILRSIKRRDYVDGGIYGEHSIESSYHVHMLLLVSMDGDVRAVCENVKADISKSVSRICLRRKVTGNVLQVHPVKTDSEPLRNINRLMWYMIEDHTALRDDYIDDYSMNARMMGQYKRPAFHPFGSIYKARGG